MGSPRRDNVFVVGCQRSGTSVVWAGLTAHPELKPLRGFDPETGYDPKELYYFRNLFAARRQMPSPMYGWEVDRAYLQKVLDATIEHCVEHHGSRSGRFVNAHPADGLHLEDILETMPEARVVYVLRHPEEVVWSALHAPWGDPQKRRDAETIRQHAQHWRQHSNVAREVQTGRWGASVLMVRHEELVEDPVRIAYQICAHVGIDADPAVASQLGAPTFNSSFRNSASARELAIETRRAIARARRFRRIVFDTIGAEMEALGYSDLGNPPLVVGRTWATVFSARS